MSHLYCSDFKNNYSVYMKIKHVKGGGVMVKMIDWEIIVREFEL